METAVNQNLPQRSTDPLHNVSSSSSSSRKRPPDHNVRLEDSPYYKMRAIVRDLRPHFIEVLKTPDFQNCKAAEEIREKMKIVMDLYRKMIAEPPHPEFKNVTADHPSSSGEIPDGQKHQPYTKPPEKPQADTGASTKHAENKSFSSGSKQPEGSQPEGGHVVGGSAFGWNFVTFPESKVTYYGRTKESFRSDNLKKPQAE